MVGHEGPFRNWGIWTGFLFDETERNFTDKLIFCGWNVWVDLNEKVVSKLRNAKFRVFVHYHGVSNVFSGKPWIFANSLSSITKFLINPLCINFNPFSVCNKTQGHIKKNQFKWSSKLLPKSPKAFQSLSTSHFSPIPPKNFPFLAQVLYQYPNYRPNPNKHHYKFYEIIQFIITAQHDSETTARPLKNNKITSSSLICANCLGFVDSSKIILWLFPLW